MKKLSISLLFLLAACSSGGDFDSPHAAGIRVSQPEQCVPYARRVSGIQIYGDAHTWWDQAPPQARRFTPMPGAVLVLASTPKLPYGHLAVVKRIIDDKQIDVTHSNWGWDYKTRSIIYNSMRVEDVSPTNDWSQLRFWNMEANSFGFPYAARGFIYPYN